MRIKNTDTQYGVVTILLHWVIALLILSMLVVGLYMTGLPNGSQKLKLYGLHKAFGILVLMLVSIRILWRVTNIAPLLPASVPPWQKFAAHAVHWMLYALMFAMPITGLLMTAAAGLPASFFGLFTVPNIIAPDDHLRHFFKETHETLAYGLIGILCLHIGAALKHHFINKDDVFRRIFW